MLKLQKIEKKKLIAYIGVIAVIFAGTGFFVYKNYILTAQNNPVESNDAFSSNKEELSAMQKNKNKHLLDSDIFNNPKFQALQNNSITQTLKINTGKDNPFKPY